MLKNEKWHEKVALHVVFFKATCGLGQALSFYECSEELWSQISFIPAKVKNQYNSKVRKKVNLRLYWNRWEKQLSEETNMWDAANHAHNFSGLIEKDVEKAL